MNQKALLYLVMGIGVTGCGNDIALTAEEEAARAAARPVSGLALDSSGTLSSSTVWCDNNDDNTLDEDEISATTAEDGSFELDGITQGECLVVRAATTTVNTGEDTSAFTLYSASSDSEVVSPLTTVQLLEEVFVESNQMAVASVAEDEATASSEAEQNVITTLGMSENTDLNLASDMDLGSDVVFKAMQSAEHWIGRQDFNYSLADAHVDAHPEDNGGVGALTYVPDFTMEQLGLSFTDVWVPDVAETYDSTQPVDLWFDIEANRNLDKVKISVALNLLNEGNASDLNEYVNNGGFTLDNMVHAFEITPPESEGAEDASSYALAANESRHVESSFTLPSDLEEGTYALIYTVSVIEGETSNSSQQGELLLGSTTTEVSSQRDSFNHVAGSIIVGNPDKPNLRVLFAELENYSVVLNDDIEKVEDAELESQLLPKSDISLNLEVEAMAQNVSVPVEVQFDLMVDSDAYPLFFYDRDETGAPFKQTSRSYNEQICRVSNVERITTDEGNFTSSIVGQSCSSQPEAAAYEFILEDGETVNTNSNLSCDCATMVRQEPIGETFALYLSSEAKDALIAKGADYDATLRIQLDAENAVDEWNNNISDNIKDLTVAYLHEDVVEFDENDPEASFSALEQHHLSRKLSRSLYLPNDISSTFDNTVFDATYGDYFGNNDFAAGYNVGVGAAYRKLPGTDVPIAFWAGSPNWVKFKIFGEEYTFLDVGANLTVDADDPDSTGFNYGVIILDQRIWGEEKGLEDLGGTDDRSGPITLESVFWTTTDDRDNEQYTIHKEWEKKQRFWLGPVPMSVTGGLYGQLGIQGSLERSSGYTFTLSAGPLADISGSGKGGIDWWWAAAGVGVDLQLINIANTLDVELALQPTSNPVASLGVQAPFSLNTLDGRFYLWANWRKCKPKFWGWKCWREHRDKGLLHWSGYGWYHHWIPGTPYSVEWAPYASDSSEQEWMPTSDNTYDTVILETSGGSSRWLTAVGTLEGRNYDWLSVKDCNGNWQRPPDDNRSVRWWKYAPNQEKEYKIQLPGNCDTVQVRLKTDGSVTTDGIKVKLWNREPALSEYTCSGFGC